jgi:hypothetical protein
VPGVQRIEPFLALSCGTRILPVHVDAEGASVDLRGPHLHLVSSQPIGLGRARYVLRFELLASAKPPQLVGWIAPTVQRYLTGKLEP